MNDAVVAVLLQRYAPTQAFTELNVLAFIVCLYFPFLHSLHFRIFCTATNRRRVLY